MPVSSCNENIQNERMYVSKELVAKIIFLRVGAYLYRPHGEEDQVMCFEFAKEEE
jgi:hypothetical protein